MLSVHDHLKALVFPVVEVGLICQDVFRLVAAGICVSERAFNYIIGDTFCGMYLDFMHAGKCQAQIVGSSIAAGAILLVLPFLW